MSTAMSEQLNIPVVLTPALTGYADWQAELKTRQHCPDGKFGQQAAAQLSWFHIVILLTKLDNADNREWYAAQAVQQGWSRTTLELNIKNRLRQRSGVAVTNFEARLPLPIKSIYDFPLLTLTIQDQEFQND